MDGEMNVEGSEKKAPQKPCPDISVFVAIILFGIYVLAFKFVPPFAEKAQVAEATHALIEQIEPQPAAPEADTPEWTVQDQYGALFEENPDMIGWIKIDGTTLDYPVMQRPGEPDVSNFYLTHGFDKEYSRYGVPYAAGGSKLDPQSDNIFIQAHHMNSGDRLVAFGPERKNGTMFGVLENYKNEAYWREHPTIQFDTIAGFGSYEIFAVFIEASKEANKDVFIAVLPFYDFVNAAGKNEFVEYVLNCNALSLYKTGVGAKYGDKLITLSTCEYSEENGRLVVVARKVTPGP